MAKPPPRLFVEADLSTGAAVPFSHDQTHYLNKVLRLCAGDTILAFNGLHGEWSVILSEIGRRGSLGVVGGQTRPQIDGPDVTLMFAPVKKTPTEFIVQKATEMGARVLQPIRTARTMESKIPAARWAIIAQEAAEQCERLSVPTIEPMVSLVDALSRHPDHMIMFADESGDDQSQRWGGDHGKAGSADEGLKTDNAAWPWGILIGPAGGFTPEERDTLRAREHCVPVSLGPRILKAETAAIVALTLWQARLGDLSS